MRIAVPGHSEYRDVLKYAGRMKLDLKDAGREQFLAAFIGNDVAGFVRLKKHGAVTELATLGVRKRYRGKGIAAALIGEVQQMTRRLHLITVIPGFFERHGFRRISEVPFELREKYEDCKLWDGYGDPVPMEWINTN